MSTAGAAVSVAVAWLVSGCSLILPLSDDYTYGSVDASVRDGAVDASSRDAAPRDAATSDAGMIDGGSECLPVDRTTYYRDGDGDDFGVSDDTMEACEPPSGYVEVTGDCDDADETVHPTAAELCDGADQDCDTVLDEGLLGPVGGSFNVLASSDGCCSGLGAEVVAHDAGYTVVTEASSSTVIGRWMNADGSPLTSRFTIIGSNARGPVRATLVEPSGGAAKVVVVWYDATADRVRARRFPIGGTGDMTLDVSEDLPLFDGPELSVGTFGDEGVLVAWSVPTENDSVAVQGIDTASFDVVGPQISFTSAGEPTVSGLIGIDSSPPSALLATTELSGVSMLGLVLRRLVVATSGVRLATDESSPIFPAEQVELVASDRPLSPTQTLLTTSDVGPCAFRFEPGIEGEAITLETCSSLPARVVDAAYRGGVISLLYADGTFEEIPVVPGAEGTPRVDLGIGTGATSLAMRGASGMVVSSAVDARSGRLIGCE